jgi:uncharacterized protein (TIGR03086 family)
VIVHDLRPAATRLIELIEHVPEELLTSPTPCAQYSLRDLLAHVDLSVIYYIAAANRAPDPPSMLKTGNRAGVLDQDWRTQLPHDIRMLAQAWQDEAAWTGTGTRADGVQMPGDLAGLIALDELVLHGWDIARTIGHPYTCDVHETQALLGFITRFTGPTPQIDRNGLFGAVIALPDDASLFDQVLGLAGREPDWTPH